MAVSNPELERRVRARLDRLEAQGLKRSLQEPSGIDLCSNDYLGMAVQPRVRNRFCGRCPAHGRGLDRVTPAARPSGVVPRGRESVRRASRARRTPCSWEADGPPTSESSQRFPARATSCSRTN